MIAFAAVGLFLQFSVPLSVSILFFPANCAFPNFAYSLTGFHRRLSPAVFIEMPGPDYLETVILGWFFLTPVFIGWYILLLPVWPIEPDFC